MVWAWPASALLVLVAGFGLGLVLWSAGADYSLHDTYYVVARGWVVAGQVAIFLGFGAVYWLMARRKAPYRWPLGLTHWLGVTVGTALTSGAALPLILSPPARYLDYETAFEKVVLTTRIGDGVFWAGIVAFVLLLADLGIRTGRGAA